MIARRAGAAIGVSWLIACGVAVAASDEPAPQPASRLEKLNAAFLKHLDTLGGDQALAAATAREGWQSLYRDRDPAGFVPDALAVLDPRFRSALEAFDAGRSEDVARILEPLCSSSDPFLAANATYFRARALVDLGKFEEVETELARPTASADGLDAATPFAPHLAFLRGIAQARNLHFSEAGATLSAARGRYADAPEAVLSGMRQLQLELERREAGTLDEVAGVMQYVADRLQAIDAGERVRARQSEVLTLLDKLIEEQEQQEKSSNSGGNCAKKKKGAGKKPGESQKPSKPRDDSEAPSGSGDVGDLHAAPKTDPGEMWGKLPPTEREKILQSLRDRFPSRYRQLVEQYYRSLAEQK
ncbi:MAG: hypothetical protein HZB38_17155 [Planctomycetes bacterium]|nr:hypothetical protein [Planctomycetota bacterium]